MRVLGALAAVALLALVPASVASADADQESTMQDDSLLVYGTPAEQSNALDMMKALGVDRVRVTVYWRLVAPDAGAASKPKFESTDPDAYPSGSWDRYDTLVRLAALKGIGVNFNISAPAPTWATSDPPRDDVADVCGRTPPSSASSSRRSAPATRAASRPRARRRRRPASRPRRRATRTRCRRCRRPPPPRRPRRRRTPRRPPPGRCRASNYWSLWNEPNQGGWLAPQWQAGQPWSPRMYRALVDNAYPALVATGHGGDVILVGETAPKGRRPRPATSGMKPLDFLRYLYCVDQSYRPLQGAEADAAGCPSTNNGPDFVAAHPGLFAMTGLAHHPYNFPLPPNLKSKDKNFAAIADTPRLVKFINRIMATYGQGRQGGIPIFFTEYGYQTRPPDPLGVSWTVQAAYLDETESRRLELRSGALDQRVPPRRRQAQLGVPRPARSSTGARSRPGC